MSLVFLEIFSSIWLLFPIQPIRILTKFLIIFNSDFLPVFRQFSLLKMTFSFQFLRLLTSRFSNYNYWGIVLLYTKIQKFPSILSGIQKYSFVRILLPKYWSIAFYAPTSNHFDISIGDRAHQILPPRIFHNFFSLEKWSTFD